MKKCCFTTGRRRRQHYTGRCLRALCHAVRTSRHDDSENVFVVVRPCGAVFSIVLFQPQKIAAVQLGCCFTMRVGSLPPCPPLYSQHYLADTACRVRALHF